MLISVINKRHKDKLSNTDTMAEENKPQPTQRKVRLEDFFCNEGEKPPQNISNGYNKNYAHNNQNIIAKHQQEFGHKKRIKP